MKKYLIAGLTAAGFVVASSGSALALHPAIAALFDGPVAVVAHVDLTNSNSYNTQYGDAEYEFQGVEYGGDTFKDMAGINSNGFGINAGTGSSQVVVNAAATIDLSDGSGGFQANQQDALAVVYSVLLSNDNDNNDAEGDAYSFQGVQYGGHTFQFMSGINSNGFGINAGTGSSQVIVNAAANITLSN